MRSRNFLLCILFVLLVFNPANSTPINNLSQKSLDANHIENIEGDSDLFSPTNNFLKEDANQNEKTFLPRNDDSLFSREEPKDSYLTLQKSGKLYHKEAPLNSIFLSLQDDPTVVGTTTTTVSTDTAAATTTATDPSQAAQATDTTTQAPAQVTVQVDTTSAAPAPDATAAATDTPAATTTEVTTTTDAAPAATDAPTTTSTTVTSTDAGTATTTTVAAPAPAATTTTTTSAPSDINISDEIEKVSDQLNDSLETIKEDLESTNEQLLETLKSQLESSTEELVQHVKSSTKQISTDIKSEGKKTRDQVTKSAEEVKKDVKVMGAKVDVNIGETISLKVLFLESELKTKKEQLEEIEKQILELEAKLPVEGAGICGNHNDCGACTKDPRCGWCSAESKCVEGDKVGPLYDSCSFYDYEVCSGSACAQYKECSVRNFC